MGVIKGVIPGRARILFFMLPQEGLGLGQPIDEIRDLSSVQHGPPQTGLRDYGSIAVGNDGS
jgi:hypothetical protein